MVTTWPDNDAFSLKSESEEIKVKANLCLMAKEAEVSDEVVSSNSLVISENTFQDEYDALCAAFDKLNSKYLALKSYTAALKTELSNLKTEFSNVLEAKNSFETELHKSPVDFETL
ncbi:hypothetical protein PTKIN_Ptkin08bG0080100 [Pterospermum kingtungense]